MSFSPNDGKMIEYYIKEEVKKETSDDRIKNLIKEILRDMTLNNGVNVKNIYVCTYIDERNDRRIGLFNRKDIFHPIKNVNYSYSYSVYTDTLSGYVGIYSISNNPMHNERWLDVGEGFDDGSYVVNCKMEKCLGNFDKFRQLWREDNNITTPYDASTATREEMTTIRDYIEKYNDKKSRGVNNYI